MDADRNLLFGVLALQADIITPAQFIEACTLWASRKNVPLADLLTERGWLTANDQSHVEYLLERKLQRHLGDLRASLAASTPGEVKDALASLADADIQQSLDGLAPVPNGASIQTIAFQTEGRGRYTLLHLHAKGGIGKVWLARDQDLGREVALKELLPERGSHPAVLARFLEEARITGQLEHPGIVPVYELTRHADSQQPFYTMRFLKGRTLTDAIRVFHERRAGGQAGPLELRDLLTAFVAICNAVAYAHSRRVLHRDLKPRNVVLGDFGEVMILDWGLAKVIGTADDSSQLPVEVQENGRGETIQGQILGTPAYMAPEQAEGRLDRIDERSDVYGLGAILYEILTGQPPFPGKDTQSVLARVIHETPASPSQIAAVADTPLEAICLKALAKRPEERYTSAKALAHDIQHWLADEPVAACADPWVVKTRRWVGRHQVLTATAAATVVVAALSLAASTVFLKAANDRERQAKEAEQQAANRERQARQAAEANLKLARKAVDRGFTRVSEIPELKGQALEELRRDLLREAKEFYELFVKQQADEPELQAERGRAYLRLALITEDIGDRSEAIDWARQGQSIFQQLMKEQGDNPDYQDGLALSLTTLGRNYREKGDAKLAKEALDHALQIRHQLLATQPLDRENRLQMAVSYNQLGLVQIRGLKNIQDGVEFLNNAKSLCEKLNQEVPDQAEYVSELAQTLHNFVYQADFSGKYEQAVADAVRAVPLLEQLIRKYPRVADYQFRLAIVLSTIAMSHSNNRHPDLAKAACEKAIPVVEQLVQTHPLVKAYTNRLAHIRFARALTVAQLGDYRKAAEETEAALPGASEGITLYNGACSYCLCALSAQKDKEVSETDREKLAGQYLESAMSVLWQVKETTGFFNSAQGISLLKSDGDLAPLRQRDDFKKFLEQIEQQARQRN